MLKTKVASGILWNALQLLINRGFGFFIKLILARLLFPEEFGLVGMAAVFTGLLLTINELGMGAALIQKKDNDITDDHYNTAFWTAVVFGILLFLIINFAIAPLAAIFYKEPMLKTIIPVMGISVLVRPLNLIHQVKLTRKLDFKTQALITNAASIVAGIVALVLAYSGGGVWSIVANGLLGGLISIPLMWKAVRWRPRFSFNKQCFRDIFSFGAYNTGTNVVNYIFGNLDFLIIGKILGPIVLGIYTLAFTLTDTFRSQFMSILNQVMYPVYGKYQSNNDILKNAYLKIVKLNSLAIFPLMLVFIVLGPEIILTFFGEKWSDSILPLQILSLSVMFHMMVNSNTALIRGMGYAKLEMNIQLAKAVLIFCPSVLIGTYYYGIIGASLAMLGNKVVSVIIAQYYLKKLVKISVWDSWKNLKECFLATFCAALAGILIKLFFPDHLTITAITMVLSYGAIIYIMLGEEIVSEIKSISKGSEK